MKISVICPFYNEEAIIERAVQEFVVALATLDYDWELILVNDGSRDNSPGLAHRIASEHDRVRLLGYEHNRGRGYALRYGIYAATGDIVITTEVDLSWGEDIVHRLVAAFEEHVDADMIVASPNLPGGGYKNVPIKRVLLSRLGNILIRASQQGKMTMYTGMTRAYRREAFLSLPIDEDEKEFHLEVAQKAQAYGFKIYEIPCVLEWKDHRLSAPGSKKRKSSSKVANLVKTHMAFAAVAAPVRYILPISIVAAIVSLFFGILAFLNLFRAEPSAFYLITGLSVFLIALIIFFIGMVSYQNLLLQREVWRMRREIKLQSFNSKSER